MRETVFIPPFPLFEQGKEYQVSEALRDQLLYQGLAFEPPGSDGLDDDER